MDPYVPMQTGTLKNRVIIRPTSITYNSPYARVMYYGKVMVDPKTGAAGFLTAKGWRSRRGVAKVVSDREFQYHGGPRRGKLWDKRMWADKKRTILTTVARSVGGVVK